MKVKTAAEASLLLGWYRKARRDLPWRRDPTPYRVWVSEVMLQQTRVEVVAPRYDRFLARFPDLLTLAGAREEDVLAEWSGLGYYRRARSLHAAAREIVDRLGGEVPRDREVLRKLPGFGPYTAGAVLSIAYNLPEPIVDGNVIRVLTRLRRIDGDPQRPAVSREIWALARRLLPAGSASEFNQSLMELGALICLPASPRCGKCPLRGKCLAHRSGEVERYPRTARPRPAEEVHLWAAVVERGGRHLLERRGPEGPSYLRGLWGFPTIEAGPGDGPRALAAHLERRLGGAVTAGGRVGTFRHSITYHRIRLTALRFEVGGQGGPCRGAPEGSRLAWRRLERLGIDLPASSLALKVKARLEGPAGD
jgi:A/G-specific adenine glycosylase